MIELKLHVHKEKFNLESSICNKFKKPIIFYLGHKDDKRNFFITFVLIDFNKKEFTYITSYSPENVNIIENNGDEHLFRSEQRYNPHCTIVIDPNEDFYMFVEECKYFYYVNFKKNLMKILVGKDLNCEESNSIIRFGSTFYKDDENDRLFYFTALVVKNANGESKFKTNFYKTDIYLKNIIKIHETHNNNGLPHVTRKYKNYLLNSHFYFSRFKLVNSDKTFDSPFLLRLHFYRQMYEDYCKHVGREPCEKDFRKSITYKKGSFKLSFIFSLYMRYRFENKDFKQMCDDVSRCKFTVLPGHVSLLDLRNMKETIYETTTANPAHFEIDTSKDDIYISNHNFVTLDRHYFIGPAAIDKFH